METRNIVLNSIQPKDLAALKPHLKLVELESGAVLYEPDERVDRVHFPNTAVLSVVIVMEDGTFDRFECSHAVTLLDIHCKYGDVLGIEDVTAYLKTLERGMFSEKIAFPER